MSRTILVPLDGTAGSEAVLPQVAELARIETATVRLLRVAPRAEVVLAEDGRVLAYADQEAARIALEVRAYLRAATATLPGIETELAVRFGDPAEEIVQEACAARVDLIAMASHRRSGLTRLREGSVAERVERAARVPVLVVTHGDRPDTGQMSERPARGRVVCRQFWCAWSQQEVEVEFGERGLLGLPWAAAIRSCSAFDPPTAIQCRRACLDSAFRRQWPLPLPVEPGWEEARR